MKLRLFFLPIFLLFIFPLKGHTQDDFDVIMQNIFTNFQSGSTASIETNTGKLLATIQEDGSWPDIQYQSHSQSHWVPEYHLKRIAALCKAYSREGNSYYGNTRLLHSIIKAMHYWLNLDPAPHSTNWYYRSIRVPQYIGRALICLRFSPKGISKKLEKDMISWMKKGIPITRSPSTNGSNLTDVAQHYIMSACLTKNSELLHQAITAVGNSIVVTTGEGIQSDHSFHAHGSQLYIYGYGSVYIRGITNIAAFVEGTQYAFSTEKVAIFSNFVRNGFIPVSRGQYVDFNILDRSISRPDAGKASPDLIGQVKRMDLSKYDHLYQDAIQRMEGGKSPSYHIQPTHFYYWRSDYTVDQKPDYTFRLRSVSTRTAKSENGNEENLKGYYMTDGVTDIAVNGNEYYGIYPVWDWNKIPGTTVPAITSFPLRRSSGNNPGKTNFVGGVSDGTYGASVYNMNDYNTTARKSWFFFDHEIVCLGSDITSTADQAVNTTVNQCLLDGSVTIKEAGKTKALSEGTHHFQSSLRWVFHDSIGYFFPKKYNIELSNQPQTGSQYSTNHSYSKTTITKKVFKLWIQHGLKPNNDSYAYIVVPGITSVYDMQNFDTSNIRILSNTNKIQAVENKSLHNLQIIFYTAGSFSSDGITLKVNNPCIMMLENINNSNISVYAADPSQQSASLHVSLKTPALDETKQLNIALPQVQFTGSTVHGEINNNSPADQGYRMKSE